MLALPVAVANAADVVKGQLPDGLTYYIMHNDKPAHRASFYIVQKVGSMQEEDNQRGLAHFLEHMAFHDTKNFPDDRIKGYLQDNGVQFGTNLNASTSFDQTIYNISNVPVTRQSLVDSCLLILHDWSGFITMKDDDIESEKHVIHEEWRTRENAELRMMEALLPQAYPKGCRYIDRMPIGLMSIVDNVPHQALRDYYHKWYRPDLQAIIVVGDVDAGEMEKRIKDMWQDIPRQVNAAKRVYYTVPDHKAPIVAVAKDKEAQSNSFQLLFNRRRPTPEEYASAAYERREYIRALVNGMVNSRLDEEISRGGSPYINATMLSGDFLVSSTELSYGIGAGFRSGEWQEALHGLVGELKRVKDHGFVQTELDRATGTLLMQMEQTYNNRKAMSNEQWVNSCVANFLYGMPVMDVEKQYNDYKRFADEVTLREVDSVASSFLPDSNQVVLLMGIDQAGAPIPSREEVLKAYVDDWKQTTTAYVDSVGNMQLIDPASLPKAGRVVAKVDNKALGTTELTLSNGARVVIKHTDYAPDNIQMKAMSPGGNSLYDVADAPSYASINAVAGLGGLGTHSALELTKLMAGKNAGVQFAVNTYDEDLYGHCSPRFLETMLQETNLCFQGARKDVAAFDNWRAAVKDQLVMRDLSMESVMQDSINYVLYSNNPRIRPFKATQLPWVNYNKVLRMFHERFSNAADFTFLFVGNIDTTKAIPLIEKYIGSLPSTDKREEAREVVPYINKLKAQKVFQQKMQTPKTEVQISYAGRMENTLRNRMRMSILSQILDMVYTETLRQQEGGTYGAQTSSNLMRHPKDQFTFYINFTTSADAWKRLVDRAKADLATIAKDGPDETMLRNAVSYMTKRHNDLVKTNAYWMEALTNYYAYGEDDYTPYFDFLNSITAKDIKSAAKALVKAPSQIDIIMMPKQ